MHFMSGRSSASLTGTYPATRQHRSGTALTGAPELSQPKPPASREGTYLLGLVLTFLLLSFSLRPSITSLPPLFTDLTNQLNFSGSELTVLATIPVFSFAVASLTLPLLYRRFSDRRLVVVALVVLGVSLVLRGVLTGWLLPFTAVSALAIGIIGAMIPGLIKWYKPAWSGPLLAAYLVGLYGGAMAGSAASVPIYTRSHGSMTLALRHLGGRGHGRCAGLPSPPAAGPARGRNRTDERPETSPGADGVVRHHLHGRPEPDLLRDAFLAADVARPGASPRSRQVLSRPCSILAD